MNIFRKIYNKFIEIAVIQEIVVKPSIIEEVKPIELELTELENKRLQVLIDKTKDNRIIWRKIGCDLQIMLSYNNETYYMSISESKQLPQYNDEYEFKMFGLWTINDKYIIKSYNKKSKMKELYDLAVVQSETNISNLLDRLLDNI